MEPGRFKSFVRRYLINNIGYKILAIVFAFILWLAILNVQDPTITKTIANIPVEILNEELITEDNVYTVKSGETATIVISGKRSIVSDLSEADFKAYADFEQLSITNAVPITVTASRYSSQLSITQKTTMMVINFETVESRTVAVQINYEGVKNDSIVIESTSVEPSFIKVTAPASVLEKLNGAAAVINYSNITEDGIVVVAPTLYATDGSVISIGGDVTVDCEELEAAFDISYTKNVEISINSRGKPADGYELTDIILSSSTVMIKGEQDVLNGISRIVLPRTLLDISDESRNVSINVDIRDYLPAGTELYSSDDANIVIMAQITEKETESTTAAETTSDTGETESEEDNGSK